MEEIKASEFEKEFEAQDRLYDVIWEESSQFFRLIWAKSKKEAKLRWLSEFKEKYNAELIYRQL